MRPGVLLDKSHNPLSIPIARLNQVGSDSAAYGGDGQTTVTVLNNNPDINLVNTYSSQGFRLHNNLFIYGSIILFPTNVFSWNVRSGKDITLDSLLLFDIIVPKVKIVVIGYGSAGEEHDTTLPLKLKKKGISCEMLATPNAITTYNFLANDSVHVAGAFVAIRKEVEMNPRDRRLLMADLHKDDALLYRENSQTRDDFFYEKQMREKTVAKVKEKKKFDE